MINVFDDKSNQKLDDDDDSEIEYRQFAQSVDTYYMDAFSKLYCKKACRA